MRTITEDFIIRELLESCIYLIQLRLLHNVKACEVRIALRVTEQTKNREFLSMKLWYLYPSHPFGGGLFS